MIDRRRYRASRSIVISLILTLFVYWYLFDTSTGTRITVLETTKNKIVAEDHSNQRIVIRTKVDISQLIQVDETYDVLYKKRYFQTRRLYSITPIEITN